MTQTPTPAPEAEGVPSTHHSAWHEVIVAQYIDAIQTGVNIEGKTNLMLRVDYTQEALDKLAIEVINS